MSFFSCSSDSIVERDPAEDLDGQLRAIQSVFANAAHASIISSNGVLVASVSQEDQLGIDLTSNITAARAAARKFLDILAFTDCKCWRISGDDHTFWMYLLQSDRVLVFFGAKAVAEDGSNTCTASEEYTDQMDKIVSRINAILEIIEKGEGYSAEDI
ncbi:hypothetical protein B484DRAFT_458500 [Ochromonadaceae sp. CCMP2298]|nr:hypothetical protein B484DRAFT_458500 [Ochromonadaceae sp. CCMP2298]|mmetsp:Transcript_17225/g.38224  ORF Transcript_17225/g.38224 Transcript_17225/m.38224 type:complete len:158 (+) Transcript_17225:147-620(+)